MNFCIIADKNLHKGICMSKNMTKPQIKMRVVNWWVSDTEENFYENYFVKVLSQKYEVIYAQKPDFLLFSQIDNYTMKTHFWDYDCVKIFFTGENVRTDFNVADYGIDFDYMDFGDRHLRLPLFVLSDFNEKRTLNKREKFCAYLVTNGGNRNNPLLRERFFDKLSEYKQVDSGGKHRNNIGYFVQDKQKWLQEYKFNLCFENSSYPGYLTEKLIDAYSAGCVPIYWGDTSLRIGTNSACSDFLGSASAHSLQGTPSAPHCLTSHNPKNSSTILEFDFNNKSTKNTMGGGGIAIIPMI